MSFDLWEQASEGLILGGIPMFLLAATGIIVVYGMGIIFKLHFKRKQKLQEIKNLTAQCKEMEVARGQMKLLTARALDLTTLAITDPSKLRFMADEYLSKYGKENMSI